MRPSMGLPGGASITPPSAALIPPPSTRTRPKPVLATPGSMPMTTVTRTDSGPRPGCLPRRSGRGLLEQLRRDVEVGVHCFDVVVLVEGIHQPHQARRIGTGHLDDV